MPMTAIKGRSQVKPLAPDQICAIIEACAKHGVTSLKLGDFEMQLGPQTQLGATTPVVDKPSTASQPPVAEMTAQDHEQQDAKALEQNEIDIREQQIAELLVNDPLAAEKLMMTGELQDADNESGDFE